MKAKVLEKIEGFLRETLDSKEIRRWLELNRKMRDLTIEGESLVKDISSAMKNKKNKLVITLFAKKNKINAEILSIIKQISGIKT